MDFLKILWFFSQLIRNLEIPKSRLLPLCEPAILYNLLKGLGMWFWISCQFFGHYSHPNFLSHNFLTTPRCYGWSEEELLESISSGFNASFPGPMPVCVNSKNDTGFHSRLLSGQRSFPSGHSSLSTATYLYLSQVRQYLSPSISINLSNFNTESIPICYQWKWVQ